MEYPPRRSGVMDQSLIGVYIIRKTRTGQIWTNNMAELCARRVLPLNSHTWRVRSRCQFGRLRSRLKSPTHSTDLKRWADSSWRSFVEKREDAVIIGNDLSSTVMPTDRRQRHSATNTRHVYRLSRPWYQFIRTRDHSRWQDCTLRSQTWYRGVVVVMLQVFTIFSSLLERYLASYSGPGQTGGRTGE